MIFKKLTNSLAPVARNLHTSSVARSGHDTRGVFGSNLPFPVDNKYVLLGLYVVFCASGLSLPFITVRSLILRKNQD